MQMTAEKIRRTRGPGPLSPPGCRPPKRSKAAPTAGPQARILRRLRRLMLLSFVIYKVVLGSGVEPSTPQVPIHRGDAEERRKQ